MASGLASQSGQTHQKGGTARAASRRAAPSGAGAALLCWGRPLNAGGLGRSATQPTSLIISRFSF